MDPCNTSPKHLTELTPVSVLNEFGELTDVKVPYHSSQDSYIPDAQQRYCENGDELNYNTPYDDVEDVCGDADEVEIRQLTVLFRGLPKEMFVNRLLLNYSSDEVKLDNARTNLLEHIKEQDDFPYGLQCELKRRLHTRTGDSVTIKLAYDVHALISVIEGADYSSIKDILSSGKGQRSQSLCTPNTNRQNKLRDDTSEIKALMQDIANVRAEMLNMKQVQVGAEQLRANQITTLKSSIVSLKTDMNLLTSIVKKTLTEIKLGIERIESDKCSGVVQLKNEVRLLKDNVKNIQEMVDTFDSSSCAKPTNSAKKQKTVTK